jgi:hypothetical protein
LLQEYCVLESGYCDTIGKNTKFLIFQSITSKSFVKFSTNGYWNTAIGDSAKLYLPQVTPFGIRWIMDDFLFSYKQGDLVNLALAGMDKLIITENVFTGSKIEYKRDKNYNAYNPESLQPFRIYPNPVKDSFVLEGEIPESVRHVEVDIISIDGILLSYIPISESGTVKKQLTMPVVHPGVYFALLRCDNQVKAYMKICKE